MDKKSIGELRRRLKKDTCTITKMCGCYVNDKKEKTVLIDENFLNLEDDEYFKYMELAKKVLSTNLGNNLLELNFPLEEEQPGGHQQFLMGLKKSGLKDEGLINTFYDMIIEKYDSLGNYLILIFHDVYDVMTKTTDNNKLDESEEIYEYVICAICPMVLSKPGLGYKKEDERIGTLNREWMVGMPETGFIFPAFNERSSDIHCVHMYSADSQNPHKEMIEDILGCREKLTFAQKQDVLTEMVQEVVAEDDLKEIMQSVHIELAQKSDMEPEMQVNPVQIAEALESTGISEEKAERIGSEYVSTISNPTEEELPLLSDLIPSKAAKAVKDQNEKILLKEEIKELNRKISEISETGGDIIIKVNDEKKERIHRETIQGETYLVIPVSDDDEVKIN